MSRESEKNDSDTLLNSGCSGEKGLNNVMTTLKKKKKIILKKNNQSLRTIVLEALEMGFRDHQRFFGEKPNI